LYGITDTSERERILGSAITFEKDEDSANEDEMKEESDEAE